MARTTVLGTSRSSAALVGCTRMWRPFRTLLRRTLPRGSIGEDSGGHRRSPVSLPPGGTVSTGRSTTRRGAPAGSLTNPGGHRGGWGLFNGAHTPPFHSHRPRRPCADCADETPRRRRTPAMAGMHGRSPWSPERPAASRDRGGGAIVNISSIAGLRGYERIPACTAAKFGVRGPTKAAALDLAAEGIRVNAVLPGSVRTSMTEGMEPDTTHVTTARSRSPRTPRTGASSVQGRKAGPWPTNSASWSTSIWTAHMCSWRTPGAGRAQCALYPVIRRARLIDGGVPVTVDLRRTHQRTDEAAVSRVLVREPGHRGPWRSTMEDMTREIERVQECSCPHPGMQKSVRAAS